MPCRAVPPWPCYATPTVSRRTVLLGHCYAVLRCATRCRGVRAVPCRAVPRHAFGPVPCRAVPCPASPSHFLPSAASSSGAAKPPATPLTITGPAGGCSPPRRTSRLWRASGNAGPAPRAGSSQHGCARARGPPCTGVRRHAVCPGGGMRACGVRMQLCEGLKQWGGWKRVCSVRVAWCEGLQCWRVGVPGFAVLVHRCARICRAGVWAREGLQHRGWTDEGLQRRGGRAGACGAAGAWPCQGLQC